MRIYSDNNKQLLAISDLTLREPMDFYEGPRGLPYEAATDANDDRLLLPGAVLTVSFGTRPPQATVKGSTENNWVALFPAECPPGNFRHYHGYPNNWLADPGATAHGPWEGQLKMPDENNLSDSGKYHVRYYMADHTLIGQADVRGLSKAEFLQYCDDLDVPGSQTPVLNESGAQPLPVCLFHSNPILVFLAPEIFSQQMGALTIGLYSARVPFGLRRQYGEKPESTVDSEFQRDTLSADISEKGHFHLFARDRVPSTAGVYELRVYAEATKRLLATSRILLRDPDAEFYTGARGICYSAAVDPHDPRLLLPGRTYCGTYRRPSLAQFGPDMVRTEASVDVDCWLGLYRGGALVGAIVAAQERQEFEFTIVQPGEVLEIRYYAKATYGGGLVTEAALLGATPLQTLSQDQWLLLQDRLDTHAAAAQAMLVQLHGHADPPLLCHSMPFNAIPVISAPGPLQAGVFEPSHPLGLHRGAVECLQASGRQVLTIAPVLEPGLPRHTVEFQVEHVPRIAGMDLLQLFCQ